VPHFQFDWIIVVSEAVDMFRGWIIRIVMGRLGFSIFDQRCDTFRNSMQKRNIK
jgi:hypothetical protein